MSKCFLYEISLICFQYIIIFYNKILLSLKLLLNIFKLHGLNKNYPMQSIHNLTTTISFSAKFKILVIVLLTLFLILYIYVLFRVFVLLFLLKRR